MIFLPVFINKVYTFVICFKIRGNLEKMIYANQFENFNIDSWINTACPGLAYDNPLIINHTEL